MGNSHMAAMRKLPVGLFCRNPTALPLPPNQRQIRRVPSSPRGAYASSRTLRRDAMDALAAQDERRLKRTAKSCGPDTPTLVSSWRKQFRRRRWLSSPAHRGEHEAAVKTIAQGRSGENRRTCSDYARVLYLNFAREAAGAAGTRLSLRPLFIEGHESGIARANGAARLRTCVLHRPEVTASRLGH